ncbi:PLAT/LH2 domain-containing protein (plasmid) [Priestia megaterium]|uniref:PLAT/LH2 domain-containing protein n=1 Tax=Priestia megaterium TaxID=1404 RepID=UPI0038783485
MTQIYKVGFETADEGGAGTDAKIRLTLKGSRNISQTFGPRIFLGDPEHFEQGNTPRRGQDVFDLDTGDYLGDLKYLYLQMDDRNTINNPAWRLNYIEVSTTVGEENKRWTFPVNKWIGTEKDPHNANIQVNNIVIDIDGVRNEGVTMEQFKQIGEPGGLQPKQNGKAGKAVITDEEE